MLGRTLIVLADGSAEGGVDPVWTLGQQIGPKRVGDELGEIGVFWIY